MSAPVFTSNDSTINQLEGLYIKERNPPAAISGIFLGNVGVVGEAIRGPVDMPVEITSRGRFTDVFGGRDQGSGGAAVSPLWKALANKPFGKLVVVRAAAAGALSATANATGSAEATGTVQEVTKANHVDAETTTIGDGSTSVIFEYDKTGDGVAGGHVAVNISGATSAADCANILVAAIASTALTINATHAGAGLINLTNRTPGTAGNVTITTTVANGGYTHTGMSGGTASGTSIMRLDASSVGQWGNNLTYDVAAASDANAKHFNLNVNYLGKTFSYKNFDLTAGGDNSLSILGTDFALLIKLTKLADGRPANATGQAFAGGTDGSIADADFTASARGINPLVSYAGLGVVFIAERSSATLKSYVETVAPSATDRLYLVCPDSETVSVTSATTETAGGSFAAIDRIVYCYNHPYTIDPEIGAEMLTHPTSWLASILSQVDVDIHPGEEDTKQFTSGITRLYQPNLQRADYISLRQGGVCALEHDGGFAFVSGVTTCLVPGKEQITRRRMADYLQGSIAKTLKFVVKKKNTETRKQASAGMIDSFLDDLKKAERIVKAFNVDPDVLNNDTDEGLGIVRIFIQVKLISHILELVLETEIGTSVSVKEAS